MLDSNHFLVTLLALSELLPTGKRLSPEATRLAWNSIPPTVRRQLTNEHWTYAAGQYLLDPDRPSDMPVFTALLRYVFALENGRANYVWGLKADLQARMANDHRYHQLHTPVGHSDPALPPGERMAAGAALEGLQRMFEASPESNAMGRPDAA